VPRLCELYPGICLTTEEKARKTSVRVVEKCPDIPVAVVQYAFTHKQNNTVTRNGTYIAIRILKLTKNTEQRSKKCIQNFYRDPSQKTATTKTANEIESAT
jgi:predicted solute-binding protein